MTSPEGQIIQKLSPIKHGTLLPATHTGCEYYCRDKYVYKFTHG